MPYNPGNWGTYQQGLAALTGGIASAGRDVGEGIAQMIADRREAEEHRVALAGAKLAPGQEAPTSGMTFGSLGTPEGPDEGTGEGDATPEMKAASKVASGLRDVAQHGYGYTREQVNAMGLGELRGAMKGKVLQEHARELALKEIASQREQQQADSMSLLRTQQIAASRISGEHIASLIEGDRVRRAEDDAVGNAMRRYATPRTILDPDFSYADMVRGGLGTSDFRGGSRMESESERRRAAMGELQGGRGAERVMRMMMESQPQAVSELDQLRAQELRQKIAQGEEFAGAPLETTTSVPGISFVQDRRGRGGLHQITDPTKLTPTTDVEHRDSAGTLYGRTVTVGGKPLFQPVKKPTVSDFPPLTLDGKVVPGVFVNPNDGHHLDLRDAMQKLGMEKPGAGTAAPKTEGGHDAELKLANEALKAGANRSKVAAQFKQRTGKDLP